VLIITITNVRACWEHLNDYGKGGNSFYCFFFTFFFVWTRCCMLCVCHYSNKETVLFACLSSGWATTIGRLLGPKMENSIKCLAQGHSDVLPHRESNQRLLDHLLSNPLKYNRNEAQSGLTTLILSLNALFILWTHYYPTSLTGSPQTI